MTKRNYHIIVAIIFCLNLLMSNSVKSTTYYQLKTYVVKDKSQSDQVEEYLKNAYLPSMHKIGVHKIGVFKPIETDASAGLKIIVLIPYKKLDLIAKTEEKLSKDAVYIKNSENFNSAPWDNPPFVRVESVILKAFDKMPNPSVPNHATPKQERIYELRSYEGPTESLYKRKVEMFNEGGEVELFAKLGFEAVFYGEVISGNTMPNLMYMTTFANMKAHDEHWAAFRIHPEWKELSALEKYKHTVSKSVIQLLHPTDYSDF